MAKIKDITPNPKPSSQGMNAFAKPKMARKMAGQIKVPTGLSFNLTPSKSVKMPKSPVVKPPKMKMNTKKGMVY